jgi:hypothetical protein
MDDAGDVPPDGAFAPPELCVPLDPQAASERVMSADAHSTGNRRLRHDVNVKLSP